MDYYKSHCVCDLMWKKNINITLQRLVGVEFDFKLANEKKKRKIVLSNM